MEAALRTAVETLTGEELAKVDFEDVRGTDGIKEATYNVAGMDVKVAVASGLQKYCMTTMPKKQFENRMRILRFRNYMKNFWEDREAKKRMRFYIHLI